MKKKKDVGYASLLNKTKNKHFKHVSFEHNGLRCYLELILFILSPLGFICHADISLLILLLVNHALQVLNNNGADHF